MDKWKIFLVIGILLLLGLVFLGTITDFFNQQSSTTDKVVLSENEKMVVPDVYGKTGYFLSNENGEYVWLQVPESNGGGGGKGITGGFGITSIDQPDTMLVSLNLTDFNKAGDERWADKNLSFLDLNDTPNTYVGEDGNFVRVKTGGGLEFVDINLAASDVNNADFLDGFDSSAFVFKEGRAGGQTIKGGTGAGEDLSFWTNATGTIGDYYFTDLTSNGFVKTNDATGRLSVDTGIYLNTTDLNQQYYSQIDANGTFVKKAGDTMAGDLQTRNVFPATDNLYNLGTQANRWLGIYGADDLWMYDGTNKFWWDKTYGSLSVGSANSATGVNSATTGSSNSATGDYCFSAGINADCSDYAGVAFGSTVETVCESCGVIGSNLKNYSDNSLLVNDLNAVGNIYGSGANLHDVNTNLPIDFNQQYVSWLDGNAVYVKTTGGTMTGLLNGIDGNFSGDLNGFRLMSRDGWLCYDKNCFWIPDLNNAGTAGLPADFNQQYVSWIDGNVTYVKKTDFNSLGDQRYVPKADMNGQYASWIDANATFVKKTGDAMTGALYGTDANFSKDLNATTITVHENFQGGTPGQFTQWCWDSVYSTTTCDPTTGSTSIDDQGILNVFGFNAGGGLVLGSDGTATQNWNFGPDKITAGTLEATTLRGYVDADPAPSARNKYLTRTGTGFNTISLTTAIASADLIDVGSNRQIIFNDGTTNGLAGDAGFVYYKERDAFKLQGNQPFISLVNGGIGADDWNIVNSVDYLSFINITTGAIDLNISTDGNVNIGYNTTTGKSKFTFRPDGNFYAFNGTQRLNCIFRVGIGQSECTTKGT